MPGKHEGERPKIAPFKLPDPDKNESDGDGSGGGKHSEDKKEK